MKVPLELGGGGVDNVGYVLSMEAIAEACASTAVVLAIGGEQVSQCGARDRIGIRMRPRARRRVRDEQATTRIA